MQWEYVFARRSVWQEVNQCEKVIEDEDKGGEGWGRAAAWDLVGCLKTLLFTLSEKREHLKILCDLGF